MLRFLGAAILLLHMAASASAATVASAYAHVNVRILEHGSVDGSGRGRSLGRDVVRSGPSALTINNHEVAATTDEFTLVAETLAGAGLPGSAALTVVEASGSIGWNSLPFNWSPTDVMPATTLTFEVTYDVFAEALSDGHPDEYAEAYVDFSLQGFVFFREQIASSFDIRFTETVPLGDPSARRQGSLIQTWPVPEVSRFTADDSMVYFWMSASAEVYSAAAILPAVAPVPLPGTWPLAAAATGALVLTGRCGGCPGARCRPGLTAPLSRSGCRGGSRAAPSFRRWRACRSILPARAAGRCGSCPRHRAS